jgi:hypothetical protein
MRKALFCVGTLLLLVLLPAANVWGQAVYGSIVGTVIDSSRAAMAKVNVTIADTGKGVSYTATTNESGNYSQTHLIAGIYEVRVAASGFQTFLQKNVKVEVDSTTQVNAQLTVGNVGEVVNVTGEAPLLKTEKGEVSDT